MTDATTNERATRLARVAAASGLRVCQVLPADAECPAAVVKFALNVNVICEEEALPEALFVVRVEGDPRSSHRDPIDAVAAVLAALLEEGSHD